MKDLIIWVLGEHSDTAQASIITTFGYWHWWTKFVTPAVAKARRLNYRPTVVHRFPGATFGSYRVTLADFLKVAGTDWSATVKRQTMPAFRWPWQAPKPPVEYRAYLPDATTGDVAKWYKTKALLADAGCGAYFEGVKDTPQMNNARGTLPFSGCEPFWDVAYPLRHQDPCIVSEDLLDEMGADFRGKNWPAHWVPLEPRPSISFEVNAGSTNFTNYQRRTLILRGTETPTIARFAEVEAQGWTVGVFSNRLVEMEG